MRNPKPPSLVLNTALVLLHVKENNITRGSNRVNNSFVKITSSSLSELWWCRARQIIHATAIDAPFCPKKCVTCGSPSSDRNSNTFHCFAATREQNASQNVSSPMRDFKTSKLPSSAAMHTWVCTCRSRHNLHHGESKPYQRQHSLHVLDRSQDFGFVSRDDAIIRKSGRKVQDDRRSMRASCIWDPARGATRPKLSCTTRFTRA